MEHDIVNDIIQSAVQDTQQSMQATQNDMTFFNIFFVIVLAIVALVFVMTFVVMFSPKARAKMMGKQVKAMKYMVDENEKNLHDIATKAANASKDAIETTTRAIKKGLTKDE